MSGLLDWKLYELGAAGSKLCSVMSGMSSNEMKPSRNLLAISSDISLSPSSAALNEISCWRSSSVPLWIQSLEKLARSKCFSSSEGCCISSSVLTLLLCDWLSDFDGGVDESSTSSCWLMWASILADWRDGDVCCSNAVFQGKKLNISGIESS